MKLVKISVIAILFIVIIIGSLALKTFRDAGEFKKITPHLSCQCRAVSGVLSSEDITIHPRTGMAFISSDDRRNRGNEKIKQGAIYGFDLTSENPRLINLTTGFKQDFHPHGIGLFLGQGGSSSLFVVNHRRNGHFIEIFDYRNGRLFHRESIGGPLMYSPNDVLPVGPRAFYVTNDHGNSTKLGRTLEEYLRLRRSYVLYFNGNHFRIAAGKLSYANGINISRDGKTVYVAATTAGRIYVYNRDTGSGTLAPLHSLYLETGADNIELDEMGNLWVGAHPKLLTFVKYAKNPRIFSPSQVLKIRLLKPDRFTVDEVYLSRGKDLSGSSVAAVFKKTLLIGSVFDHRFLMCKLP